MFERDIVIEFEGKIYERFSFEFHTRLAKMEEIGLVFDPPMFFDGLLKDGGGNIVFMGNFNAEIVPGDDYDILRITSHNKAPSRPVIVESS